MKLKQHYSKGLIVILLLLVAIPISYSAFSEDRTDYYNDGTYYWADGIETSDDIAINGSTVVNGDNPANFGWTVTSGTISYSNVNAYKGTVALQFDNVNEFANADPAGGANATFTGQVGWSFLTTDHTGTDHANFYIQDSTGNAGMIRVKSGGSTFERYDQSTLFDCSAGTPAPASNTWFNMTYNFTDYSFYVNGAKCGAGKSPVGGFVLWNIQNYGTQDTYIDDFWISNLNERPSAVAPPPTEAVVPFLFTNGATITELNEDTKFYIGANYTLDGVNTDSGDCSFAGENISAHFHYNQTGNFTLNESTDELRLSIDEGFTNIIEDRIEVDVCRDTVSTDLNIYMNDTLFRTVDSSIIPVCGTGFHEEINLTTEFNGIRNFDLVLKCDECTASPSTDLTIITNADNDLLVFEREFSTHSEDMPYSSDRGFYVFDEYYYTWNEVGNFSMNITCNDTSQVEYFDVTNLNLTIVIDSIDDTLFFDGIEIESSLFTNITVDVSGDVVTYREFNVTYENGTVIKTVINNELIQVTNQELNLAGIYNLSLLAIDDEGNTFTDEGWFRYNDTAPPELTWTLPQDDGSSEFTVNISRNIDLTAFDINLFAYEVLVYDPDSDLRYNFTDFPLSGTTENILESITPDELGNWSVNVTVTDSHTKKEIKDYKYKVDDKIMEFSFEKIKNYKKEVSNVTIEYIGSHDLEETIISKNKDRYEWQYNFYLGTKKFEETVLHRFKVHCSGLYPINSDYKGHFVCWDTRTWIDFENPDIIDYEVFQLEHDTYEIRITMNPTEIVKFESIGGLNSITESTTFEVKAQPGPKDMFGFLSLNTCNNDSIEDVLLTFFIFIMISVMYWFSRFIVRQPLMTTIICIGLLLYGLSFIGCVEYVGVLLSALSVMLPLEHWSRD